MIRSTTWTEDDASCVHIGLVNNMAGAALEATERQFRTLLCEAAQDVVVRLSLVALPDVPRSIESQRRVGNFYSGAGELWNTRLDGLIVTGAEPQTTNLIDEPYWTSLTKLVDWAEHNTHSTIWSCLAAHAAVLHTDGVARRPLNEKLCGVFECVRLPDHPLTASAPQRWKTPHSRWNDVPEDALATCGYRVLARSAEAGADAFVKQGKSLFVFFQGHPEYEAHSLLLEYRRDIRRFLAGKQDLYPSMPQGCFDAETATLLNAVRERALSHRSEELLAHFPATLLAAKARNTWRSAAASICRNWLLYLSDQKERRLKGRPRQKEYSRVSAPAFGTPLEMGVQTAPRS